MFTIATTIGYGTFAPITSGGRVFTMFMAFATIGAFINALTQYTTVYSEIFRRGSEGLASRILQVAERAARALPRALPRRPTRSFPTLPPSRAACPPMPAAATPQKRP